MARRRSSVLFASAALAAWLSASLLVSQPLPLKSPTPASSAEIENEDPYRRDTPHDSMLGFLEAAHAGNFATAAEYIAWPSRVAPAARESIAREVADVLDVRFFGNLDMLSRSRSGSLGDGLPPDQEKAGALIDAGGRVDVILERRLQSDGSNLWFLSWDTVREARRVHKHLIFASLEERLPAPLVEVRALGIPLWRLLSFVLALPLLYLVSRLLVAGWVLAYRRIRRSPSEVAAWSTSAARPATLLLTLVLHRAAVFLIGFPLLFRLYYNRLVNLLLLVGAGWLVLKLVDLVVSRVLRRAAVATFSSAGTMLRLGRRVAKALLVILVAVLGLASLGINLTPTLAGIGIGGIAIAFAAQKSLENVFGGLSVLGDRVIRIGDFCRIGTHLGEIEDITLYATRLRTLERTVVHIPNGLMASERIDNYSRRDKFWFHPILGVRYETSVEQMSRLLADLRAMLAADPRIEPSSARVRFLRFGAYSLDIELFAYVLVATWADFLAAQEELNLAIMKLVEASGTDIAFPSTMSYLSRDKALGAWEPLVTVRTGTPREG
jgi:MscS family membrane protein